MQLNDVATINNKDSILLSLKSLVLGNIEDSSFDDQLIIHINSLFMELDQMGIDEHIDFEITGPDETWLDLYSKNIKILNSIKTFIYLNLLLIFDPPQSSYAIKNIENLIARYQWRIIESAREANNQ